MMLTGIKSRNPMHRLLSATQRHKRLWGLALISPWLIGVLIFKLIPILAALVLSFTDFYLLEPSQTQFIGFENFAQIFKDSDAWSVLLQTMSLALVIIPVQMGASVLLATVLSHKKLKMKNAMRSLFFLPSVIPSAAAMMMFEGFVNPTSGWLNKLILGPIGLAELNHLSSRSGGQTFFILTSLWAIGPGFLIVMSALQSIPSEIYEAAQIDGANLLQRFFVMTVPLISPAIFFTLILNLTAVFGGSILLDRGNSLSVAMSSFDSYIHYALFSLMRLGYASSLAWTFFIFVMILVLTLFGTAKHWVYFPDAER